jgi:hypothetical protein
VVSTDAFGPNQILIRSGTEKSARDTTRREVKECDLFATPLGYCNVGLSLFLTRNNPSIASSEF